MEASDKIATKGNAGNMDGACISEVSRSQVGVGATLGLLSRIERSASRTGGRFVSNLPVVRTRQRVSKVGGPSNRRGSPPHPAPLPPKGERERRIHPPSPPASGGEGRGEGVGSLLLEASSARARHSSRATSIARTSASLDAKRTARTSGTVRADLSVAVSRIGPAGLTRFIARLSFALRDGTIH